MEKTATDGHGFTQISYPKFRSVLIRGYQWPIFIVSVSLCLCGKLISKR